MPAILSGENALITRTLKQADATQLLFSALTGAIAELRQGGVAIVTKTLNTDPELRAGPGNDTLRLEVTSVMRAELSPGVPVEVYWWTTVSDADFTVDAATHKDWAHDPAIDVFELE